MILLFIFFYLQLYDKKKMNVSEERNKLTFFLADRPLNPQACVVMFGVTMREVPQRLASPSEETPKKKKDQISVAYQSLYPTQS